MKKGSHLAVACRIIPTQTQARCNSPVRKQKELNLEKIGVIRYSNNMPSLGRYCQGVIRYKIEYQASADTAKV